MTNTTHAQFTSCTPIMEFQNSHKISLAWTLPSVINGRYDKVEIYRFIGGYMESVDPSSITETTTGTKKIYTAIQKFSGGVVQPGVTIETYSYSGKKITTKNTYITSELTFIDDFDTLEVVNPTKRDIGYFHELVGNPINRTLINDIGFSRRVIYYLIKPYTIGAGEIAPYLLTPDEANKTFICHSTKSQVRHNYLHYEGDEIWWTVEKTTTMGDNDGISRTAVDINRLFLDPTHQGPRGAGGYAWVSDRKTSTVFQHKLKDGYTVKSWPLRGTITNVRGRGFGIGIHPKTGNCYACPGDTGGGESGNNNPTMFVLNINDNSVTRKIDLVGRRMAYGVVPLNGYNNRMFIADWRCKGKPAIYNTSTNKIIYGSDWIGGYASASCPNGKGIQKVLAPCVGEGDAGPTQESYVALVDLNAQWFYFDLATANTVARGGRIGIDLYTQYPNSIINSTKNETKMKDYFTIWTQGGEFGVHIPSDASLSGDCSINWSVKWKTGLSPVVEKSRCTAGYDSENNTWVVNNSSKIKTYRTACNRRDGDPNELYVYPYGGYSRYPAVLLDSWPSSITNTKEIEWFLTRNYEVKTLDPSNYTQTILNQNTLNNTESAAWLSPSELFYNQTAKVAWKSMIESKMLRQQITNSSTKYTSCRFFNVYNNNTLDGTAHKHGIRMDVSDTYAISGGGIGLDKFYETRQDIWLPIVKQKIRKWAKTFADYTYSYPNISGRLYMINGNLSGIPVHPFYSKAVAATDDAGVYINPSLSQDIQDGLKQYTKSIKYYEFKNMIAKDVYMYSDFTGNLLAASIDSTPLNTDMIHPEVTNPSISLTVSGYQSNPGYQDTPAYCYPWKNTLPVSMSATYNNICGYDDFNVTYFISSNMGSYLITSFSLSTNDFTSPYYDDLNNIPIITDTKNLSYVIDNIYDQTTYLNYTYQNPTVNGLTHLPSGRDINASNSPSKPLPLGVYQPSACIQVVDLYDYNNGGTVINATDNAYITVFERWPEPKFYVDMMDDANYRKLNFCASSFGGDRFDKSEYVKKESNAPDAMRYDITYGVDPISAQIQDRSIARTWPMSSWMLNITTNNTRLGWPSSGYNMPLLTSTNLFVKKDDQGLFPVLSTIKFRYGDYGISMFVNSHVTNTSSDRVFFQEVKISEFEPFANFYAVGGQTVKPDYSTNINIPVSADLDDPVIGHNGVINIDNVLYPFISGYAPYFNVSFKDASEAHTFPISSYHWNFGDAFNEGPEDITQTNSNYYTISDIGVVSGNFANGCWTSPKDGHLATHTYIMPGTYDVSLTVKASCTQTSDICSRYIGSVDTGRKFYVYVEEILPSCNDPIYSSLDPLTGFTNVASGVGGVSPVTAYFNANNIKLGSFPICRIDWDFGDGTIERITRYPKTEKTTQGLSVRNTVILSEDTSDPRTAVVPHVYTNKTDSAQSFSINISTYACNTNSMIECYSIDKLVAPILPEISISQVDTKKLIGSRFDDAGNLIYIIEGEKNNTTYTVVLTGELNNV